MQKKFLIQNMVWILILTVYFGTAHAQILDFGKAGVMTSSGIKEPVRSTAMKTLQEEVEKRTSVRLAAQSKWRKTPMIVLAKADDPQVEGITVPKGEGTDLPETKPEGFRIVAEKVNGQDVLWLIGADERGVIFAIGEFLRRGHLSHQKIQFDKKNEIATSPAYPMRGHQLGFRHTANSWDAWTVEEFDQHIRELALFGTNSIENTPFHDGGQSPVMVVERSVMNIKMSEICDNYGLEYWVWVPSAEDLSDEKALEAEVKMHIENYKDYPRLDGVFFPGGDPGKNHPRDVMAFLKRIAEELEKIHPEAGVWISLQNFSEEKVDYFYEYLEKHDPDWLAGVATGPSSPGLAETRYRLPEKYGHRDYPDITHTVRCQYPTLNWDQAFALTEGREVSNPEPYYYAEIFRRFAPFTDGFITYSDGVHDDVNKIVWSQLGWNPDKKVNTILEEYGRLFFGPSLAEETRNGILGLESNWDGPTEQNGGIESTFQMWNRLEKEHPELKNNWRWQMLLMRAYYDTYTARRKAYEKGLEEEAMQVLAKAPEMGAARAMDEALKIVNKGDTELQEPGMRQTIVDYLEALNQSIGLQTSVEKHHAKNPERGAVLDFLDYPLNNRWWLSDQFDEIRKLNSENEKLERLHTISTWENPGPGSYYDNISDVSQSPRVLTTSYDATDVAWWDNGMSRARLSTQLFQNFPVILYEDLDPEGIYMIRIAGEGDALLRINGQRVEPSVYNKGLEEFKEFHVPRKFLKTGEMKITFDEPEESHLNWRRKSKVSDIWLLKQ